MENNPFYEELPQDIKDYLFMHHSHRQLPDGTDEIVYREADVLALLNLIFNTK